MTAEFIRHEPCEVCGSSDAKAVYSDGNTFCFSCHNLTRGEEEETITTFTNVPQFKGSAQRLNKRKLSEKTCEHYKIYRDGELLRFPYFNSNGVLQGFKTKNKLKEFKYEGTSTDTLFGQHLIPSTGKSIIVYEGELDAASGWEAYPNWPHVSLPHGAASAKKDIQKQLQLFQGYKEVILFFDKDEAGRRATEQVAALLPSGTAKIANLADPYKDASDALQAGDTEAIRKAIWNAETYRPDGIVEGKSLLELVTNPSPPCDYEYPFAGLQQMSHGIRFGELVTITSGTGQGKSTFCRQLATHLLETGEKVGYIALEESNRRTALGLMSVAAGKALHLGEQSKDTLIEAYGELGVIGICMLLFGFMITNLIKENKSQTMHIDEIQQDLSAMKSELSNTMNICVKLIDSVNGFKLNVNDKLDRRHEALMKEVDDLSDKISYLSGRINGGKH